MNIKLIGTGAMYTAYNSACTLIDNRIIVDMPNGTVKQLLKQNIDVTLIDTILVTHMHGDHTADIPFFLKYIFNYLKIDKPIRIIGPVGIKNKITELFNAYNFENQEEIDKFFNIEFIEILENEIEFDDYFIKLYLVLHGQEKPALGYVINNKLGLTGDSGLCDNIEQIFKTSDIVISDSSFRTGDDTHLGIDNLDYLTQKYNKKVLCTHLRDKTRNTINNSSFDSIIVKEDFDELEI